MQPWYAFQGQATGPLARPRRPRTPSRSVFQVAAAPASSPGVRPRTWRTPCMPWRWNAPSRQPSRSRRQLPPTTRIRHPTRGRGKSLKCRDPHRIPVLWKVRFSGPREPAKTSMYTTSWNGHSNWTAAGKLKGCGPESPTLPTRDRLLPCVTRYIRRRSESTDVRRGLLPPSKTCLYTPLRLSRRYSSRLPRILFAPPSRLTTV